MIGDAVTVIITAHREGDLLLRAIESVVHQSPQIIIVLDAPDDITLGIARGVCMQYSNVKYHKTPLMGEMVSGICFSRNYGISHMDHRLGQLVFPLDADDTVEPDSLDALRIAYHEASPGGFIYGGWNEVWPNHTIPHPLPAPIGMLTKKHITHGRILFHWTHWVKVNGYNPRFEFGYEDWAFTLALVGAGVKGVRLNKIVYNYYQSINGRAAKARPHHDALLRMLHNEYPHAFQVIKAGGSGVR